METLLAASTAYETGRSLGGGGDEDPWKSGQGAEMKAGFMDGCRSSSGTLVDCGCAFEQITSHPEYDTPERLATLAGPVDAAQQSGDPRDMPAVLVTAMRNCLLSSS